MTKVELSEEALSFGLHCALVSREPNIFFFPMDYAGTGFGQFEDGTNSLEALCRIVGPGGYLLATPWWSLIGTRAWEARISILQRTLAAFPEVSFAFLCNEPAELEAARQHGFAATLLNQNAFVNESTFRPAQAAKEFDAIYVAKMDRFKRHELASGIDSLALVYNHFPGLEAGFQRVRGLLPNAGFLNGDPTDGTHTAFAPWEVAAAISRARVGLCLSAVEGAMYAAVEYLVCGLPVVSTVSTGGREFFFDPRWCEIVEPNADAVAAAVRRAIERDTPPEVIRQATLERMAAVRGQFLGLINRIRRAAGVETSAEPDVRRIMASPWACWTYRRVSEIRGWYAGGET